MESHLHDTRVVDGRSGHANPVPRRDLLPVKKAQGMPKPEVPPPDSPLPEKEEQLLLPTVCVIPRGRRDEVLDMLQLSKIPSFFSGQPVMEKQHGKDSHPKHGQGSLLSLLDHTHLNSIIISLPGERPIGLSSWRFVFARYIEAKILGSRRRAPLLSAAGGALRRDKG